MDADPPTTPGRVKPTSNRKTGMQIAASVAALLLVVMALAHDLWAGDPGARPAPVLTSDVLLGALAVMGVGGAGAQLGNVGEHIAKALPQVVEAWARGKRS